MNFKTIICSFLFLLMGVLQISAQIRVPFKQRTSQYTPNTKIYNIKGDFTIIGNTNLTLVNYNDNSNNNNNPMRYVDVDNDPTTINSSSATLRYSTENGAIPTCSNVLFAGIYWSGRTNTNVSNIDKRKIKIKAPGQTNYQNYTAANTDINVPGDDRIYASYVEITDLVRNNGLGEYFVADIATSTGTVPAPSYYGGWSIIVVYENSKMKWRDVTVFDGYAYVPGETTINFELPVDGFYTVQNGPVNMKLGVMAGEGDKADNGDYFEIQKVSDNSWLRLNHTGNTPSNFFNSSILTGGNPRNPNLINNTGVDISMFNIPNANNSVITNNQTTTKFRYGSTNDTYIIYSIAMSVDAYVPDIEGISSITSINNNTNVVVPYTVEPGQEISYKVKVVNEGTEPVSNTKIKIPIPYTATYVANSGAGIVNFTPSPTPNTITFDPTQGANGTLIWDIGTLPVPNDPTDILGELTFKLKATENCSILKNANCDPSIKIFGYINGTGAITGVAITDKPFIRGYNNTGQCMGEPITNPLVVGINASNYVNQNCANTPNTIAFNFCNITSTIPLSQVSSAFPPGTLFYNQFPVTATTIQYTTTNPFPNTSGTVTYYAVPPGAGGCYFAFTITNFTSPTITAPTNVTVEGCGTTAILGLPFSTTNMSITLAQFLAAGGTTSNTAINYDISYIDIVSGTCPLLVKRTFTIKTICNNDLVLIQNIIINDSIAPVLTMPFAQIVNVNCGEIPPAPPLVFADNCSATVTVLFSETINNMTATSYVIIRNWAASDACNNTANFTQTINVTIGNPLSSLNSNLCTGDVAIDLLTLLPTGTTTTGTWTDVNNSGGLTGSTLDPTNIVVGNYMYTYTITQDPCPRVIQVNMNINDNCIVLPCNIADLKISKVVTPNNDGHNDYFEVGGLTACGFKYDVKVYNRWGSLVYENKDYKNDWFGLAKENVDGNSNLPAGTYYYIVDIVNSGFDLLNGYIYLGTKSN